METPETPAAADITQAQQAAWHARVADYDRQWAEWRKQRAAALAPNKAVLFDALAAGGVARVVISFDGSGDSGQMEEAAAFGADDAPMSIPATTIALQEVAFGTCEVALAHKNLRDALEILAWELMEQTHGGWENNDGGYGEFAFDVAECTITLEFNERYTETNYYEHQF